jgi:hypothetical protein
MAPETPRYYAVLDGHDLYALFATQYGTDALLHHLEMEAIQYLWRARRKGQYATDIRKAHVILERIEQLTARTNPDAIEKGYA